MAKPPKAGTPADEHNNNDKPDLERARTLLLMLPSVLGVGFHDSEGGKLDGIRVIVDGSLPTKQVVRSVESVLLVDMNYKIDYRKIFVVLRREKVKTR